MSDKIKCMAGSNNRFGEPIVTKEQCLECAAHRENNCGYTYSLLKFMYRKQADRSGIHVTDLTGCLKRAFFSKTEEVIDYPHKSLMLALGSITHALLEVDEDEPVIETEVPLNALGIEGTTDVIHHNGKVFGPFHLQDQKTTRWLKPSNLPYGSHDLQLNIYAALQREQGTAVESASIQYIDLSGPTKCRQCKVPVEPDLEFDRLVCPSCGNAPSNAHLGAVEFDIELRDEEEIKAYVEERRDELLLSLEMGDPPEAEPSFLCKYCPFIEMCPEGMRHEGRLRQ